MTEKLSERVRKLVRWIMNNEAVSNSWYDGTNKVVGDVLDEYLGEIAALEQRLEAAEAEIERMEKAEPVKLSDAKELNDLLLEPDPSFHAWRDTIPQKYWARYDLSAVKLGWSAAMKEQNNA